MKVYRRNQQRRQKVNLPRIERFLTKALQHLGLEGSELSVLFVNDLTMKELNRAYRGIDNTTDVLSFPQADTVDFRRRTPGLPYVLGDIVINLHKTSRQAKEYHSSFYEELKKLLIHGLLHLIGYDHGTDVSAESKMASKSRELSKRLTI